MDVGDRDLLGNHYSVAHHVWTDHRESNHFRTDQCLTDNRRTNH